MPLVDVAYFRNRLRSLRRLDLMHKMKGNHTILHYAVDRQDAAAVDLILTKISDPHDQNLLMCTKNEFGLSPHEAALNITTNKVRGDILRLFADARARIEDDDDEVLEEDYDDNTKSS